MPQTHSILEKRRNNSIFAEFILENSNKRSHKLHLDRHRIIRYEDFYLDVPQRQTQYFRVYSTVTVSSGFYFIVLTFNRNNTFSTLQDSLQYSSIFAINTLASTKAVDGKGRYGDTQLLIVIILLNMSTFIAYMLRGAYKMHIKKNSY